MENQTIKFQIDQTEENLERIKKHISSLFSDVIWDLDKELKSDATYHKKEISKEILEAWGKIEKLENHIQNIKDEYKWASKEPEESKESEESIEIPW